MRCSRNIAQCVHAPAHRANSPSSLKRTSRLGLMLLALLPVLGFARGEVWVEGDQFVRLVKQDTRKAPRNAHPAYFTSEQIVQKLLALHVAEQGRAARPAFGQQEVYTLATYLATALARAKPKQDVVFRTVGGGAVGERVTNTGRVFVHDGHLNMIFGELQARGKDRGSSGQRTDWRDLPVGARKTPSRLPVNLVSNAPAEYQVYDGVRRADWLVMPAPAQTAAVPAVAGVFARDAVPYPPDVSAQEVESGADALRRVQAPAVRAPTAPSEAVPYPPDVEPRVTPSVAPTSAPRTATQGTVIAPDAPPAPIAARVPSPPDRPVQPDASPPRSKVPYPPDELPPAPVVRPTSPRPPPVAPAPRPAVPVTVAPAPAPIPAYSPPPIGTRSQVVPSGSLDERLRVLKRLHQEGLIGEDEYRLKVRELLREL